MAFDPETLAVALGVDREVVERIQGLGPDDLAENVAGTAVDTVHSTPPDRAEFRVLGPEQATNTLLGLQNTDWSAVDPEVRVEAAVYFLNVLGDLGLSVTVERQQHGQ